MTVARRLAAAIALSVSGMALAGCNAANLTKTEMVVYFGQNAPESDHVAALKACAHVSPQTVPEPLVKGNLASDNVGDVRFRIDHANDKELAELSECLNKQPGVVGIDTPDLTD